MQQRFSLLRSKRSYFRLFTNYRESTVIERQYKMNQYNTLNVKLSNSLLNKLKSEIKDGTQVTLNLSSYKVGDSKEENNFPHKLLLQSTQVLRLREAFVNNSSANTKL